MPEVYFDNQIFKLQTFGGISHYFAELIELLPDYDVQPAIERAYSQNENYLRVLSPKSFEHWLSNHYFKGRDRIKSYLLRKAQSKLIARISSGKPTLFHPTYYGDYYLPHLHANTRLVLTVHDMTHELLHNSLDSRLDQKVIAQKKALIERADKIIAISEQTQNDIVLLNPQIDQQKIVVIHHGIRLPAARPELIKSSEKYLLFVGNRDGYKNFEWLIRAIHSFLKTEKMKLCCYGSKPFSDNELDMLKKHNVSDLVFHRNFSSPEELNNYYRGAFAFIFPSAYEGFGYPILEAFVNNCPVILPASSCFPEVGGSAACFYTTDDAGSLVSCLSEFTAPHIRQAHIEKGWIRAQQFDIKHCIKKHAELYKSLQFS
jgi:glycosyltransferase involved in cell wall biosynthesis